MDQKNNCLICGNELEYYGNPKKMRCSICHHSFMADVACKNGHYICDSCHGGNGYALIEEVCRHNGSRNPIRIAQMLMEQPSIHMMGPEHHVMVGAVLLAAYHNCGGDIKLNACLKEMVRRGKQLPGGTCGFWGCCGAVISAGMFLSIITDTTPIKKEEWRLCNLLTAEILTEAARLGGPRCCKRNGFLAIQYAVAFTKEHFGVEMQLPEKIQCGFSHLNKQCLGTNCPYYKGR